MMPDWKKLSNKDLEVVYHDETPRAPPPHNIKKKHNKSRKRQKHSNRVLQHPSLFKQHSKRDFCPEDNKHQITMPLKSGKVSLRVG
jgi:hypothetical protein